MKILIISDYDNGWSQSVKEYENGILKKLRIKFNYEELNALEYYLTRNKCEYDCCNNIINIFGKEAMNKIDQLLGANYSDIILCSGGECINTNIDLEIF